MHSRFTRRRSIPSSLATLDEARRVRDEMERRSRAVEATNACDAVFDILKDRATERVLVSSILSTIEASGIQLSDPRLKECMKNIRNLQKRVVKCDEDARNSFFLDRQTFCEAVRVNVSMLLTILKNSFAIPEFHEFAAEVRDIYDRCVENTCGNVAGYIPQLARADPARWAVSVCTVDGQRAHLGDYQVPFCLQSVSKPLNYALAMTQLGSHRVHQHVGYEPSGVSFNSIALNAENKPHNPMINSGAIVICSLLSRGERQADRFDFMMREYRRMCGGEYLGFCNPTFLSERESANRNCALAYYMKENGCFPPDTDLRETLDFYMQLCAMEVTCESASVIAATLANGGICPLTGEPVLTVEAVRDTLSLMHSCGMYDYSGQFAFKCGLPAKSGVSGIILLVVPNLMGIAMWSPPLDKQGNSCRGIQFCMELVARFNLHNYDSLLHSAPNKADPRRRQAEAQSVELVAILFSAYNNDLTALRSAFLQGAAMCQTDYDGRTALHVAAAEGHAEVVRFLVDTCGVDVSPRDRWGQTPLSEAERFGHIEVEHFLRTAERLSPPPPPPLPTPPSQSPPPSNDNAPATEDGEATAAAATAAAAAAAAVAAASGTSGTACAAPQSGGERIRVDWLEEN